MTTQLSLDLEVCRHPHKINLHNGFDYCTCCGAHWKDGAFVSRQEWDAYMADYDRLPWD